MPNEKDLTAIQKALDFVYDQALEGLPKIGVKSAEELAEEYRRRSGSQSSQVDSLINWQCAKTGATGFLTGLGGAITLPVTIPADLSAVMFVHLRMVASIAHMGGHNIYDDKVRTMAFLCLCGDSAREILRQVGEDVAMRVGKNIIDKIPGEVIKKINKLVGYRFLTKAGEKGTINLMKLLPLLGGLASGTINAASTKTIGRTAKKVFIPH